MQVIPKLLNLEKALFCSRNNNVDTNKLLKNTIKWVSEFGKILPFLCIRYAFRTFFSEFVKCQNSFFLHMNSLVNLLTMNLGNLISSAQKWRLARVPNVMQSIGMSWRYFRNCANSPPSSVLGSRTSWVPARRKPNNYNILLTGGHLILWRH